MGVFVGNDFLRDALLQLLRRHFSNGYRLNSPIAMRQLRERWREDHGGEELLASDHAVRAQIAAFTIQDGQMAFLIPRDILDWLQFIVTMYLGKSQVIFYEAFFARHQKKLSDAHIFSESILIAVLRQLFPDLHYEKMYFGKRDGTLFDVITDDIIAIWGDKVLWTYEELADRLYIPYDKIKQTLGARGEFLWVSNETYTHVSRVAIRDEVKVRLREKAQELSEQQPFWSIKELPIDDVLAENYELETESCSAIYDAIYAICLADHYDKKGVTVTQKGHSSAAEGRKMSAIDRMRAFCRERDVCTLSEMNDYAKKLTKNSVTALRAALEIMVRVDAENFVSDSYVAFDVARTDEVLSEIVVGEYLVLKDFVSFAHFPACGKQWNRYLLESYCRRFSRQFRFEAPQFNNGNVGAVIRKTASLRTYDDLLADAVLHANIDLERETVGQFLCDFGYVGKMPIDRQLKVVIALAKVRG